jgi:anti-sigma factor RsiW
MSSPCRRVAPLLEPFGDGELAADKVVEMETHLTDCACCRESVELNRALKLSLSRAVHEEAAPSKEFAERIARALSAERERETARQERRETEGRGRPLAWRFIVPVAAAAGATLVWGALDQQGRTPGQDGRVASMATATAGMTASVDEMVDELVSHHAASRDPDVVEPSLVQKLEPEIGVPVHVPSLHKYGLRWEGASVVPVRQLNQRAASLRYSFDGHRVTLYVYNSKQFPLRATLEPRVVRNTPVYVGSRRGYSVAAIEKRGVGYAVATDLDDRESAELVVASMH